MSNKDSDEEIALKQQLAFAHNDIVEKELTISKMSDEIENLLESSAMVNAKMNILQNDLVAEREEILKYKMELETLRTEMLVSQKTLKNNKEEKDKLKNKIHSLNEELEKRPSCITFNELKSKCNELELAIKNMKNTVEEKEDKGISDEYSEIEEELVKMKELYARSNEDKLLLEQKVQALQKQHNDLKNRSHNVMFFYIAPLIFLVLYLLYVMLFS